MVPCLQTPSTVGNTATCSFSSAYSTQCGPTVPSEIRPAAHGATDPMSDTPLPKEEGNEGSLSPGFWGIRPSHVNRSPLLAHASREWQSVSIVLNTAQSLKLYLLRRVGKAEEIGDVWQNVHVPEQKRDLINIQ